MSHRRKFILALAMALLFIAVALLPVLSSVQVESRCTVAAG